MSTGAPAAGILHLLPLAIAEGTGPAVLPPASLSALRALHHFVVEDARSARRAIKELGHPVALQQLDIREIPPHAQRQPIAAGVLTELLAPLAQGEAVGVLSEAGCPGIADPGAELARWAQLHGHRVVAHVGPSSLLLALMGSGLEGQHFSFHGYLPIDATERDASLRALEQRSAREAATQLFIETPYRNQVMLQALLSALRDDTLLTIAIGLTGPDESLRTRAVADWKRAPPELPRVPAVFALLSTAPAAGSAGTPTGQARRRARPAPSAGARRKR